MSNPETQKALKIFSQTLLSKKGGEAVVLAVKDVPKDMGFYEALAGAGETLEVIKRRIEIGKSEGVRFRPVIRASRNVALRNREFSRGRKCDLIILGFPKGNIDYQKSVFSTYPQALAYRFIDPNLPKSILNSLIPKGSAFT